MTRAAAALALVGALAFASPTAGSPGVGTAYRNPAASRATLPPLRMADPCVTVAERRRVVRFTASDRTRLIGLVLGGGSKGVVLAHEANASLCSWLPYARRLAASGLRVLLFDSRGRASSGSARTVPGLHRVDLDVVAAVRVLRARGVGSVVLGGASAGGTAAIVAAARLSGIAGVFALSSPGSYVRMDAVEAIPRVFAPTLLIAAEQDTPFPDEARTLYEASASAEKVLEVVLGGEHGTRVLRDPAVHALVTSFVRTRLG